MSSFKKITETASLHDHLEKMTTSELLECINQEDQKVASAVAAVIPAITLLVDQMAERFALGGRLFYLGAGTSGRLGILDASEIPPTYGFSPDRVIGLIAGGDAAIRRSVESAEDDGEQAWKELQALDINDKDTVVGIAASGTTPYVVGGLRAARAHGILTAGLCNNPGSPVALAADIPIEINVGPEFVTGSTRMKSGTSQKLALNMISTALMIRLGRVQGNKMVNMQLNNDKLVDRGIRFIMEELGVAAEPARELLQKYGSVSEAIRAGKNSAL